MLWFSQKSANFQARHTIDSTITAGMQTGRIFVPKKWRHAHKYRMHERFFGNSFRKLSKSKSKKLILFALLLADFRFYIQ
jgi:hypothetical protein